MQMIWLWEKRAEGRKLLVKPLNSLMSTAAARVGGSGLSKTLGMLSWTSDGEGRKQAAVFPAWSALRIRRKKNVEKKVPCAKWCRCPLKSPPICVYVNCHPQTNCKLNNHLRTKYGNKSDYIPTLPLSHIILLNEWYSFYTFLLCTAGDWTLGQERAKLTLYQWTIVKTPPSSLPCHVTLGPTASCAHSSGFIIRRVGAWLCPFHVVA